MRFGTNFTKIFIVLLMVIAIIGCDLGINQSAGNSQEVNIMATMGTLPTLYAGLIAISTDNASYMWYSRRNTFSEVRDFPSKISISEHIGSTSPNINEIIDYIEEKLAINENTFFNLYCDDLRVQFVFNILEEAGLSEHQYKVTLLSDGTGSYNEFNSRYSAVSSLSNWEENLSLWLNTKNGDTPVPSSTHTTALKVCMYPYAVEYGNSVNKAQYYLQWPEALISEDTIINEKISQSLSSDYGITKKTPQDILENMTEDEKYRFRYIVGLGGTNKATYDGYFIEGDKPALIISGTSNTGEGSRESFEATIEEIREDFQGKYNLFFKPHPRYDPVAITTGYLAGRKDFLEERDITILPGQMPMEALLFVYPSLKIGGYSSSLYMSVKPEQLAFFITNDINTLAAPLPYLFKEEFFSEDVKTYPITK